MTTTTDVKRKLVRVWVCPTDGCANYFASSTGGDGLDEKLAEPRVEDVHVYARKHGQRHKHTRANCPDCRQRGVDAERVLVSVMVPLPA